MKRLLLLILAIVFPLCHASEAQAKTKAKNKARPQESFRLMYWNIQNGMWDGQEDNYARFTDWVKQKAPDICVWCEAQPIYKTGTADRLDDIDTWRKDSALVAFWKDLAPRYGHKYVFLGGHRDNFPQVITSRFPIDSVARITGNKADTLVSHGAGWARVVLEGQAVNLVTVHTWPQKYGFNIAKEDREKDGKAHGGDLYRAKEIEYICRHTILSADPKGEELWLMMGDFNAISRRENWVYHRDDDSPAFLVHDYIGKETPYKDVIAEREPNNFHSSTPGRRRIDFVYATPPMLEKIKSADIIFDDYTRQEKAMKDGKRVSKFFRPSDHLPIIVDFSR